VSQIHPTAVIEPGAELAEDVFVGPLSHVGPEVVLGPGTRLIGRVTILGRTRLGAQNELWPGTTLGADPQDRKHREGDPTRLEIGDRNSIREGTTIHTGTANGGGVTRIGSENLLMVGCHIAHDCVIGDGCTIANTVQLAGHVHVRDHASIAGLSGIHHYVTLGAYAFVGGLTRIVADVPPYMIVEGHPSRIRGVNTIGLERNSFSQSSIQRLKQAYRRLFRPAAGGEKKSLVTLADEIAAENPDDEHLARLARFIRESSEGTYGRHLESYRQDARRGGEGGEGGEGEGETR